MASLQPKIDRSLTLNFVGDWGQANFHRICSWLTQQFCDRAGPRSRVAIWNIRGGGIEAIQQVHAGEAQLCITTPDKLMLSALAGEGIFASLGPMPSLRALAVLPQRDRMLLALDPKFGIKSFKDLHRIKPPLRIATSYDDGTNFIGYVGMRMMEAHGVSKQVLESWGGSFVFSVRPDQCLESMRLGQVDGVLQEAIMTPWWRTLVENRLVVPVPAEPEALVSLAQQHGFQSASIRAGYWDSYEEEIPTLDFSDFVIIVRDDMPDDVAHLLTWCLVETRQEIEVQYKHIPAERSPLTYPVEPSAMARPAVPLHPAAKRFYQEAGYLP